LATTLGVATEVGAQAYVDGVGFDNEEFAIKLGTGLLFNGADRYFGGAPSGITVTDTWDPNYSSTETLGLSEHQWFYGSGATQNAVANGGLDLGLNIQTDLGKGTINNAVNGTLTGNGTSSQSSANGGFLLYPNKINLNQATAVYAK